MKINGREIVAVAVAGLLLGFLVRGAGLAARRGMTVRERGGIESGEAQDAARGLEFALSAGRPQPGAAVATPRPVVTPLDPAAVEALLDRLPPLSGEPQDERTFALPPESPPPPRTGARVTELFPPPGALPAPAAAQPEPPRILRYMPEGEVPLAPQLSVTFSQPMVPVTSVGELARGAAPVELTPQPPGQWRWEGTRTLVFVPDGRFPMATEYRAEVPAGIRAVSGAALAESVVWSFQTPPPKVIAAPPSGGVQPRNPLFHLLFDQRIDAAAVLETVQVEADGQTWPLRLATPDEVQADAQVRALTDSYEPGRWVAFRVTGDAGGPGPLPGASTVRVRVGPGTPSAEGPRRSAEAFEFAFETFGPLKVVEAQCGWGDECRPWMPWRIEFNNPLDLEVFTDAQVTVDPPVPGLKAEPSGNTLWLRGQTQGRTRYDITLSAAIRDIFGQTLGEDVTLAIEVGAAEPSLFGPDRPMLVLDPAAAPAISVYSVNHRQLRVRLHAVGPEDWPAYAKFTQTIHDPRAKAVPPGREVLSTVLRPAGQPDEMVETKIDLKPALTDGVGHAIAVVEPVARPLDGAQPPVVVWAQATRLGLDAYFDGTDLVGWVTRLADGAPVVGAQLSILPAKKVAGVTEADGVARLPLPPGPARQVDEAAILVARQGADTAILPETPWLFGGGGWYRNPASDELRWHVFDDRGIYQPGEEVRVKGWIRRIGSGKGGDVGPYAGTGKELGWRLTGPRGNDLLEGRASLNQLGGFDLAFTLPEGMNLGAAALSLEVRDPAAPQAGRQFSHSIQVQEFRRPEFEVKTEASAAPHFVGAHADVTVSAAYYAGGGLANAPVQWSVRSSPGHYSPPGWDGFTFGTWVPWWRFEAPDGGGEERIEQFAGQTDAAGEHHLRMDFLRVTPPRPSTVQAEAAVQDVNRQTWNAAATLLVHPAAHYVGLRGPRLFVEKGTPLRLEAILTDLDGKPLAGRAIELRAVLLDSTFKRGEWREEETHPQELTLTSGAEPVTGTLQTPEGGCYRITATIADEQGRPNQSEIRLWVSGGRSRPNRDLEQETVELIPDRKEYAPGDTAEILVQAPFSPAEGLMLVARSGLVREERFRMEGATHTLRVPIAEEHIPNVHVRIELTGAAARIDEEGEPLAQLPKRPAFASGSLDLRVPPRARTLAVEAAPQAAKLEPGGQTAIDLCVRDAAGAPVAGAEVAVAVVDEAVLALTAYELADPIATFYTSRDSGLSERRSRGDIVLGTPEDLLQRAEGTGMGAPGGMVATKAMARGASFGMAMDGAMAAPMMAMMEAAPGGMGGGEAGPAIQLRSDFNPLALFAPAVVTGADGRARVNVKLPDNLTRYRVMAVAVAGARQFGKGEASITARLPIMVRPSAPRFLNFGDRLELPVVLQNQTDDPLAVDVAVRTRNLELTDLQGGRVTVPANDRVEVRFPAAARMAGTARFQVGAAAGRHADAAEVSLPVWTPATTEAFATYGEIDDGALVQPVAAPGDAVPQFGGLEISTSSTQLQALTDAVLYLVSYRYDCAEQIGSRLLAVAALEPVLSAFQAEGLPSAEEIRAAVERDVARLVELRNEDGGWGFWRFGEESWPYVTIHVMHALQRAAEAGYPGVPDLQRGRGLPYLRAIESHIPKWYSAESRRALIAYALYTRDRLGDAVAADARRLVADAGLEKLSLEAIGWLLPVLSGDTGSVREVTAIRRHLANRATETGAYAHFVTSYSDGAHVLLHSDRRADAVILEALITDQPQNDLIPKLARGLLAHRVRGRWLNTQENAFVLLALKRYFEAYEEVTPDFVARAWLGAQYAGGHEFRGRTTERHAIDVPMHYLAERGGTQELLLAKDGPGRMYYRIGLRYAPRELRLEPADYGFAVERAYEAVEEPGDVRRDPDGMWRVKAGALVRVRLALVAPSRRYHVALVDPLPAGLEPLNPELAVTGSVPRDPEEPPRPGGWWWWVRPWYEHQNMRDERVEAFTPLLWEGGYNYSYVARATTPGAFVAPPARAEEMYNPETFGRSASDRVLIE